MPQSALPRAIKKPAPLTLATLQYDRAYREPDACALTIVGDQSEASASCRQLDTIARTVASALAEAGSPRDCALIVLSDSLDFIGAFFGCLYANVIAVPCPPPASETQVERMKSIVVDTEPTAVLTTASHKQTLARLLSETAVPKAPTIVQVDNLDAQRACTYRPPSASPDDLAFLQFTSGSTRTPRGVMVSHANLLANLRMVETTFEIHRDMNVVSWLPLYHDMGLVGGVLLPQYLGMATTLMTPRQFLTEPIRWLETISSSTLSVVSGAPNFALDLCAERLSGDAVAGLDLTRWEILICGSEPIKRESIDRFVALLRPVGFRDSAMLSAYGLAEATLLVSGTRSINASISADPRALERGEMRPVDLSPPQVATGRSRSPLLISCGKPTSGSEVQIVDPSTDAFLANGRIGEVWVRGPHVAKGYWRRPMESAYRFGGLPRDRHSRSSQNREGHLRTGDLGAVWNGELYLTGRVKDLIIVRGRNIYPHDLEHAASHCHGDVLSGLCAAFSVPGEAGNELTLVQAVAQTSKPLRLETVAQKIRLAIVEMCEIEPRVVALVAPAEIPRTTSGKIRRQECRNRLLDGRLRVLYSSAGTVDAPLRDVTLLPSGSSTDTVCAQAPDEDAIRSWLFENVAELGGLTPTEVDAEAPLPALGLDSMKVIRLFSLISEAFEVRPSGEATTIASLAAEIGALLEARGNPDRKISQTPERLVGRPAPRTETSIGRGEPESISPFPLTEIQQAYLVGRGTTYALGGVAARTYDEFDVSDLDVRRLQSSFRRIVEHHEMLRAIVQPDGLLRIAPLDAVDWDRFGIGIEDLRDLTHADAEARLVSERLVMSREHFDLEHGPLFGLRVLLLPEDKIRLQAGFDLIVADLRSLQILARDWGTVYRDPKAVLQQPKQSFHEWAVAHANRLAHGDAELDQARAYWRARLESLPDAPELPYFADTDRDPVFTRRQHRVDAETVRKLRHTARRHGVSLAATLLTAYSAVLARWSRSQRFTVGVTHFDRGVTTDSEEMFGEFTAINILEVNALQPASYAELAAAAQQQLWQDLVHRAHPGTQVIRELTAQAPGSNGPRLPIVFTSGIGLGGRDRPTAWLGSHVWGVSQTPQVALDNQVLEDGGDLLLYWDARSAIFPDGVLDDMFASYAGLVESLADSERWAGPPTADRPAAHTRIEREVNATGRRLPGGLLHEPMLEIATRHPELPAVIAPDRTLTFDELRARALTLAGQLSASGIGRGSLIGVGAESGWRRIVGAFAALASGGAYCPIDLKQPESRRALIAADARLDCLLVDDDVNSHSFLAEDVPVVAIPEQLRDGSSQPAVPPLASAPDDLAYVIYTSGSTGVPKGVAVSHRAARNTCSDICARYYLSSTDRILALSSTAFDLSVFDMFGALGAGTAIVLPRGDSRADPRDWLDLIYAHDITVWNSVPALAEMLVAEVAAALEHDGRPLPLRLVLLSGDWIALSLPRRIKAIAPPARVVSLGGATEAGIWSIHHPIEHVDEVFSSIPYGKPLSNQTVQVLNDRLDSCPLWVTGELHIGGVGLASGYWRDAERTERNFYIHPRKGTRLFRTGDLGRWRPGGVIELLGRKDNRIKIGGHRIELGEIEHVLEAHPRVLQSAVVLTGERHGRRLTAFATLYDAPRPGRHALKTEDDLITDPLERLEFKLRRHSRRRLDDVVTVELGGKSWWDSDLVRRVSCRAFASSPVPLSALGELLSVIRSNETGSIARHAYASADGLYPIQLYLHASQGKVADLCDGTYYYDSVAHRLALLDKGERLAIDLPGLDPDSDPAFLICLVAQREAIAPLYGRLWRDFALIEVGHICHLLEQAALRYGLGLCQLGGATASEAGVRQLRLDACHELLHVMAGGCALAANGKVAPAIRTRDTDGEALREHIAQHLPAHMVPSTVVLLDEMPITVNGKLDRQALESLAAKRAASRGVHADPATDVERVIVAQAQAVLGIEDIGATDNFFYVGASSVALVEIYQRVRTRVAEEFPLLAMFEFPDARSLGAHIVQHSKDATGTGRARKRAKRTGAQQRRADRGLR